MLVMSMVIELFNIIATIMTSRRTNAFKKLKKLKVNVKPLMKMPMSLKMMKENKKEVKELKVESLQER